MRASDIDRQRTIEELRRHCAAGRLDVDEYAHRLELAMSATTLEELDRLRSDLPMVRIADPLGRAAGIWASGRKALPGGDGAPSRAATVPARIAAVVVSLISVLVVLSAIVLGLAAEWAWAGVLLAGWVLGVLQGRLGNRFTGRR